VVNSPSYTSLCMVSWVLINTYIGVLGITKYLSHVHLKAYAVQ
jgi:hypothetical protein